MVEIPTMEDFSELKAQVDRLELVIKSLAYGVGAPANATVDMIAKWENVSTSHLYSTGSYLLPRFGESAFPTGPKRWPMDEYLSWKGIDPEKRYQMWLTHLEGVTR